MRYRFLILWFLLAAAAPGQGQIEWQDWSEELFEQAKKEEKFVILDLEAVWCHWCHVMEDTTYQDPDVVDLIKDKYIPVRVDQDAHPDLSLRYEDWGWPATIIFAPDGTEIAKRQGYIPPKAMASLLEAIIKDPTPGPSVLKALEIVPAEQAFLAPEQKKTLVEEHLSLYDTEHGGWGMIHKLIDWNSFEYALNEARAGDKLEEEKARRTLDQALNLEDPVWGGFYQYSDERDWKSPHFEKIMIIQAQYLRLYALAHALWNEPRYLEAAKKIESFVANFWTGPEGEFYTSQDADVDAQIKGRDFYPLDDAGRRKLGRTPRIDKHVYARENGWMITGLAALYHATGDEIYLNQAVRAARWVIEHRALPDGGFRHDEADRAGPYLGDTLAMGQAFLTLYESTGDRGWLEQSKLAASFIHGKFKEQVSGGFVTAVPQANAAGVFQNPVKQVEENVSMARWMNALHHYSGLAGARALAEHAMRYLAAPAIIENRHFLTGILIADGEMAGDPAHITIVGPKDDAQAKQLFLTALRYPSSYRRIEWWDRREGPLPNADVTYPELEKPAAFLCANKVCSLPFFTPERLLSAIRKRSSPSSTKT